MSGPLSPAVPQRVSPFGGGRALYPPDTRDEARPLRHQNRRLSQPGHLSSEIAALGSERLLVIERDLGWLEQAGAFKWVHAVDLGAATDATGDPGSATGLLLDGKTLEEITIGTADPAAVLARHGVQVATKTRVSDLIEDLPGWSHDKPEGLAVLDDSTLVTSNDDDFGVTSSDPAGRVLQKINPATGRPDFGELRVVRLREPLRETPGTSRPADAAHP